MNIYAYQRPVGKIDDIPELRNEFITIFDTKDKNEIAQFRLILLPILCIGLLIK